MAYKTIPDIINNQHVARLSGDCSIREAGRYMVENGVGSVLIMEDDKLQGIFTERDALRIFVATRRNPDQTNIADVMTKDPKTITPDTAPEEAIKQMIEGNFRHMPVVDNQGVVMGVVSQRDFIAN